MVSTTEAVQQNGKVNISIKNVQARNNGAVNQIPYLENDYLIRRVYRN